jgi:hypothetical protein
MFFPLAVPREIRRERMERRAAAREFSGMAAYGWLRPRGGLRSNGVMARCLGDVGAGSCWRLSAAAVFASGTWNGCENAAAADGPRVGELVACDWAGLTQHARRAALLERSPPLRRFFVSSASSVFQPTIGGPLRLHFRPPVCHNNDWLLDVFPLRPGRGRACFPLACSDSPERYMVMPPSGGALCAVVRLDGSGFSRLFARVQRCPPPAASVFPQSALELERFGPRRPR